MRRFACAALGAVAQISALPASAGFSGDYTIIFYSGPAHHKTGKECVTFTNTGNIVGFPDSGTWTSSTLSGWGGNFVVDGKILRWYGTFQEATAATSTYNRIENDIPGRGGFDEWNVSTPPITAVNDGTTSLRPGCKVHQVRHSGSPTR
jgi:hypothetical protein